MVNSPRIAVIANAILLAALLVLAHGLLKWVAQHPADSYASLLMTHWTIIVFSIMVYCFVFFYYAHLLKKMEITQLYPIYTGLSIVFLLLVGVLVFKEHVTLIQGVGCFLIIAGIFWVSK